MLLTISTERVSFPGPTVKRDGLTGGEPPAQPFVATDLGYLLHKHPDKVHPVSVPFGRSVVVYPEASDDRCTAALVVELDPVGLVRNKSTRSSRDASLDQYVNDRPYAASSILSVALGKAFGTALTGRSKERPDLASTPLQLEACLPVVPCRGGEELLESLFGPLGYEVEARQVPLDPMFASWGPSPYFDLRLRGTVTVRSLLEHLFVLLPVLDDAKHYWVGDDEVDKLLRRGSTWLPAHPHKELIARRYLRHDRRLTNDALERLMEEDVVDDPDEAAAAHDAEELVLEERISLNDQRIEAVLAVLRRAGAKRVVDLGCGPGRLVGRILRELGIDKVVGVDVSTSALTAAARRLHLDTMAPRQRERVELLQGALTYRDRRLAGFDAATLVEVIEHIDPPRLAAMESAVFGHAQPRTVVVTTPNIEYNQLFSGLGDGRLRHRDHRFEWDRNEFRAWASAVAQRHGYELEIEGIGPADEQAGCPTQMAVFSR